MPLSAKPDQVVRRLFLLNRTLQSKELSLTSLIDHLMDEVRTLDFASSLKNWDLEALSHGRHFAEEMVAIYVSLFYDLRQIPVTYYKRERFIRKHLDRQFSSLFKEIGVRSRGISSIELITEEPIYYLLQKSREKSFPKGPKSQNRRPYLPTLKMRFHLDLARSIDSPEQGSNGRRVLLPFEI